MALFSASPDFLLSGVGMITGAASGIGKATAFAFADNGCTSLALLDLDVDILREITGDIKKKYPRVKVIAYLCDISNEEMVVQAIEEIVHEFGRIDYAVNNAGIPGPSGLTESLSTEDFQKVMGVNLLGTWMCQREEIKAMLKQEPWNSRKSRRNRGVIVNMASGGGLIEPDAEITPYTATKHGVVGFTKSIAKDAVHYAPKNIRINAVCPGVVLTSLFGTAGEKRGDAGKMTPIGRPARPEEIADAIVFLSSEMSSYMTGVAMPIDGKRAD
ncbi:MAG: hypothetical protein M1834_005811 [Cirrosporium novae-zelandiae]|nr:MAG: hypothetical protein M1834_005811 [Cirrosporium novae-zelandiae]